MRNGLAKEVVGVVEALFFDEGPIFTNGTKPIDGTLIDKLGEVEIRGRVLTGQTPFRVYFCRLPDIGARGWV